MVKRVQRRQLFKGFSSQNNNNAVLYDIELAKQDLTNRLMTRVGERVMMPTYGCIIWDLLFEPYSENLRDEIADNITEIVESDSRLSLENIIVDQFEHGIVLQASIFFIPFGVTETFAMEFDQRSIDRASN